MSIDVLEILDRAVYIMDSLNLLPYVQAALIFIVSFIAIRMLFKD